MRDIPECQNFQDCAKFRWNDESVQPKSIAIIEAIKHRHETLLSLANELQMFYVPIKMSAEDKLQFINDDNIALVKKFVEGLESCSTDWTLDNIKPFIKQFCSDNAIKMPQLAMPMRLLLCGVTHTVSLDLLLWILGYATIQERVQNYKDQL